MHKIMVPFTMTGTYTVKSVAKAGKYKVTDTIAVVTDAEGRDHEVTMVQKWPAKQAIRCYREKPRPSRVMETGVRAIDTFTRLSPARRWSSVSCSSSPSPSSARRSCRSRIIPSMTFDL